MARRHKRYYRCSMARDYIIISPVLRNGPIVVRATGQQIGDVIRWAKQEEYVNVDYAKPSDWDYKGRVLDITQLTPSGAFKTMVSSSGYELPAKDRWLIR